MHFYMFGKLVERGGDLCRSYRDFASLQRSVLCHIDSLEVINDLIGSSNNLVIIMK